MEGNAEAEAVKKILEAEAASFKKLEAEALHAEAEAIKNSPLSHHWLLGTSCQNTVLVFEEAFYFISWYILEDNMPILYMVNIN